MKESPYRNITALIADDSRSIRELLAAMLEAEGVRKVILAEDGESALAALNAPGQTIDLVLCDLAMPGIDGVETMRRIAASRLEPAIALISGYDQKLLQSVSDMSGQLGLRVIGTLSKPFTQSDVTEILKEFLLTRRFHRARQGFAITVEELDEALQNDRVEVYYQPKVQLSDGKLVSVEGLVRIQHPSFGVLEPDQFIPVAETSGRITPLTMTVLQKSITQAGAWLREGLDIGVAINMSTLAILRLDLPEIVLNMAKKAGVPHDHITIELTESQVAEGPEILHILSRFRLRDIRLSIDDYGTGQSGLQRLKRLPFSELKIDKAFVSGCSRDADMRSILEVSIELGKRLRMTVVAEGVETLQDWQVLKQQGCDLAQGYFIAKPMPGPAINRWAQGWHASLH